MILADGAVGLLLLGVWLFCIIDVITTPDGAQRNLPKLVWLFLVILLADLGSLAWLIAGRPWSAAGAARPRTAPRVPADGRRGPANPDDDEAFLAQVRARAEAQRAAYESRREAERQAEQDRPRRPDPDEPTA